MGTLLLALVRKGLSRDRAYALVQPHALAEQLYKQAVEGEVLNRLIDESFKKAVELQPSLYAAHAEGYVQRDRAARALASENAVGEEDQAVSGRRLRSDLDARLERGPHLDDLLGPVVAERQVEAHQLGERGPRRIAEARPLGAGPAVEVLVTEHDGWDEQPELRAVSADEQAQPYDRRRHTPLGARHDDRG